MKGRVLPEGCQECIAAGGGYKCPQGCPDTRLCKPANNGQTACVILGQTCIVCMLAGTPLDSYGRLRRRKGRLRL